MLDTKSCTGWFPEENTCLSRVFILQAAMDNAKRRGYPLFGLLFQDFEAYFDTLRIVTICSKIHTEKFHPKLI